MLFAKKNNQAVEEGRVLQNPKILEVNLIKEESALDFNWKKNIKSLLFALGVTIFIIVELYLGLDWWQKDEEARLEVISAQTTQTSREVAEFRQKTAEALAYQEKTVEVGRLLNDHVYWTNFFSWLEKNTLSTVNYGGFSGTVKGSYSLSGKAGSFAEVSWQVKQFMDDPMTISASVDSVSSGENKTREELATEQAERLAELARLGEPISQAEAIKPPGVSFSLNLEINPEIFKK